MPQHYYLLDTLVIITILASAATGNLVSSSTGLSPWQRTLVTQSKLIQILQIATNNLDSGFVYQTSGFSYSGFLPMVSSSIIGPTLFGSTPSLDTNKSNDVSPIISFSYFGNCDKNSPEHSAVGGEITKLVFVHDNEPTDVPRWL